MPTLVRLLEGPHHVVAVVSQPDRRRGRGRKLSPSPVAELALERGITLYRPESANDPEFARSLAELETTAPVTDEVLQRTYDAILERARQGDVEAAGVVLRIAELQRRAAADASG